MNVTAFDLAPALPSWVLYPTAFLLIFPLIYVLLRARSWIARFSIFIPWLRYMLSAFHTVTFPPIVIGLSINALASAGSFVLGLLMVRPRNLMLKMVFPFYIMMGVVILSGLGNQELAGTINVTVKFGYLLVITIGIYEAVGVIGERKMMLLLLWAFTPPVAFQILSVILGVSKATEADGSISYIGGYNHEAAFSIVLATCFTVACLATGLKRWVRSIILAVCLGGILLANYRTSIIAIAPLAIVQFNADVITRFSPRQRSIVAVLVISLSLLGLAAVAWVLRDRLADLMTAFVDFDNLLKRPMFYTDYEKTIMSARPYIWSGYFYGYADGSTLNHLIGFGPESWQGVFSHYAHNTLVSTLYEYGVVGVVAMIFLWATMLLAAVRVRHGPRAKLIGAHLSFLTLNMATMPHWLIEGDIWYAIICGCTLHYLLRPAEQKAPLPATRKVQSARRPAVAAQRNTAAAPRVGTRS
jgi:hypothetical protein